MKADVGEHPGLLALVYAMSVQVRSLQEERQSVGALVCFFCLSVWLRAWLLVWVVGRLARLLVGLVGCMSLRACVFVCSVACPIGKRICCVLVEVAD